MEIDQGFLEINLANAVLSAFAAFETEHGNKEIYAACLSATEDGIGIGLNINTEPYFTKRCAEENIESEMTPQEIRYFRWSPAEWCFEAIGDDLFQPVNSMLLQSSLQGFNAIELNTMTDIMARALRRLRDIYADRLQNVTLFVTVTDYDEAEEIENRSAILINPPGIAQAFVSRFG
jgi:hypothetical protein